VTSDDSRVLGQEAAAITQESDAETSPRYRTLAWSQQGYSLYGRPTPEPPPFTPPFSAWLCAVVPAGWDVIFVRELRQIRPEDGRVDMEVTIQRRGDEMVAAPSPEMPVIEVGDVVWIKADAAKYTVLSDLHGRWLSEDVDEIFRDGVTIWRKGATINDPR